MPAESHLLPLRLLARLRQRVLQRGRVHRRRLQRSVARAQLLLLPRQHRALAPAALLRQAQLRLRKRFFEGLRTLQRAGGVRPLMPVLQS